MVRVRDMTAGKPAKLLVSFAIPILLGNLFQQLYSLVDTMVVGRGVGVEALAAVGSAAWLDWLVLGIVIGLTQGFSILVSQRFGAEDYAGLRKTVAMSVYLAAGMAVLMTTVSLLMARPLLEFLRTAETTIDNAQRYITVIFSGVPIVIAYNMVSGVLRAMGDSKTPLYAMIIASFMNIGLDIWFVMGLKMGVAGAAIATVLSQLFACTFCLIAASRLSILKLHKTDWIPDKNLIGQLLRLGLPVAFQNGIIAAGGLVIQYIVNGYGYIFVAGITAGNKLCGLMEQAGTSFGAALGTFVGQNLGAGKLERIRMGVRSCLKIAIVIALSIAVVIILTGKSLVALFITGEPAIVTQVIEAAYPYLVTMSCMLFSLYLLFVYRSTLQGMGDTVIPMMSGIIELIMRIGMALLLPIFLGKFGVYIAEVSAWAGAAVLLMFAYYGKMRKLLPHAAGKEKDALPAMEEHLAEDGVRE